MKILYHHRTLSRDGQSVHIEELIRALRECGHEVLVVGPEQYEDTNFGSGGGIAEKLKASIPRALYEILEFGYNFPAFWRLWRAYKSFRPDIVYERYNLFMHAGIWLRRWSGLPLFLEVNGPLAEERQRYGGMGLPAMARWSQGRIWRGADKVFPVTAVLSDMVREYGVDPARLVVIPNGVGHEFMAPPQNTDAAKRNLGIDADVVLGFVGFMRPWHGLERVVDFIADAKSQRLHFVVVGDGPARTDVEERARARGVSDRVTFSGLVPRDKVISYISAFDIALQPDVVAYASPLKLFEYMALGKAVIAPSSPNIREILTDGTDAVLFDPSAQESFRASLERLARDKALRDRLGAAARQTVVTRDLTWLGNAKRITRLMTAMRPHET